MPGFETPQKSLHSNPMTRFNTSTNLNTKPNYKQESAGYDDEIILRSEEETKELIEITPTPHEMECYEELCKYVFAQQPPQQFSSEDKLNRMPRLDQRRQRLRTVMFDLRHNDTHITESSKGWVTTIDNILTVLLYRDFEKITQHFIAEVQISFTLRNVHAIDLS